MSKPVFSYDDVLKATVEYYNGDILAATTVVKKYFLRNKKGEFLEKTPDDLHNRLALEFARIEKKMNPSCNEAEYFRRVRNLLNRFSKVVPQGSPMAAIANPYQLQSLSNCFVVEGPTKDSMTDIFRTGLEMAQIGKRRGGVGCDLSGLRPSGAAVNNAALKSSGVPCFSDFYSHITRMIGQKGRCLHGDTMVLTEDGLKKISKIVEDKYNGKVWTEEGWKKIINWFSQGKKSLVKVITKQGFSITATKDHKITVGTEDGNTELKPIGELGIGSSVGILVGAGFAKKPYQKLDNFGYEHLKGERTRKDLIIPTHLTPDFGYLLGAIYGDGSVCIANELEIRSSFSIAIAPDMPELGLKYQQILSNLFNIKANITNGDGCQRIRWTSKELALNMQEWGLLKAYSTNITIPKLIWDSPEDVQCAFIAGFFDADGDVSNRKDADRQAYRISSVSAQFRSEMQKMLLAIGIASKQVKEKNLCRPDLKRLSISCGTYHKVLKDKIGMYSIKLNLRSKYISGSDRWLTLYKANAINLPDYLYTDDKNTVFNSFKTNIFNIKQHITNNEQFMSPNTAAKYIIAFPNLPLIDHMLKDEIIGIIDQSEEDLTYDITVEDTHKFWADGFYVSNSGALMLTLDVAHPDAELFAVMKHDLTKVTGANVSLRITDAFMEAVEADSDFVQQWPLDVPVEQAKFVKKIKARDLWKAIVDSAWITAEPGIINWDNYINNLPAHNYEDFKTTSTNPCVTGDTWLLTAHGYQQIRDLWLAGGSHDYHPEKSVEVYGTLQIMNRHGVTLATNVYRTSEKAQVFKLSLNRGQEIRATANHRFILEDNSIVKLSELKIGDKLLVMKRSPNFENFYDTLDAFLTGLTTASISSIEPAGEEETFCLTEFEHNEIIVNNIVSLNCSEIALSPYDSCRLISNNLMGWVKNPFTKDAAFDFQEYFEDVKVAQRMSDGLVELELEAVQKIIDAADDETEKNIWHKIQNAGKLGRRTGLGTHALGDVFLATGYKYDSDAAIKLAEKIYKTHMLASYEASIDMAKERGPFPVWNWEIDKKCAFINRLPIDLQEEIKKHGRRNIANLTVAPTGSVSIASQTSSGVEAAFRWVYDRRVKITHADIKLPVDFVDATGDKWTKFRVLHPAVEKYFKINNLECPVKTGHHFEISSEAAHRQLQKILPEHFVTSDTIDYLKGVELQGVITKYIDHGISRTINLPNGTTSNQVSDVYLHAWKSGLKGVTVYVDGSRDGVLITSDDKKDDKKEESTRPDKILDSNAPKRPKSLPAEIHHVKVKGNEWQVVVGLMDGRPYEIFAGQSLVLPKARTIEESWIIKKGSKKYCLEVRIKDNGVEEVGDLREIYDNPEQRVITRNVCTSLRHGVPIEFIVRDLSDHEGSITDYASALSRVLKKYANKPSLMTKVKTCQQCGSSNLVMTDGCVSCGDCGGSKCQ